MGWSPINLAACQEDHTGIVKILAPLTDNPNAPRWDGVTPISVAACNGHTKIVKMLSKSWPH